MERGTVRKKKHGQKGRETEMVRERQSEKEHERGDCRR